MKKNLVLFILASGFVILQSCEPKKVKEENVTTLTPVVESKHPKVKSLPFRGKVFHDFCHCIVELFFCQIVVLSLAGLQGIQM